MILWPISRCSRKQGGADGLVVIYHASEQGGVGRAWSGYFWSGVCAVGAGSIPAVSFFPFFFSYNKVTAVPVPVQFQMEPSGGNSRMYLAVLVSYIEMSSM